MALFSDVRRTAVGAAVLVFFAMEFASRGGIGERSSVAVDEALHKNDGKSQVGGSATSKAPKAWFAASSPEDQPPVNLRPAPVAQSWASAGNSSDGKIHKAPPHGVDFPQNQ